MTLSVEHLLLGISVLFFLSIMAGKAGSRFGVPALLLFLVVGMICGSDGLGFPFDNAQVAHAVGTIALCIILFSGGMDTKFASIRPVLRQGITLATLGVLLTAGITGLAAWLILGTTMETAQMGLLSSMLLAAVMSSTDSASVFSILRSKGLHLKDKLTPMLELESGSNDPMAYILTITLIGIINGSGHPNFVAIGVMFVLQLVIGLAVGFALGKLAVIAINRLRIDNQSLYSILVLTFCLFIFSLTYFLKGNGYLAVYVGGLVIGNSRFVHKRTVLNFFDGMAWMSQLIMFLMLGLLVVPHELVDVALPSLAISLVMILLARPISVFLSLLPFRTMPSKDKLFVSWVGLRGAVPIIFAIMARAENVPHAQLIFNIVFFCTLISLVVQGTTLSKMAVWLGLSSKPQILRRPKSFDVEFSDDVKSITTEISIKPEVLEHGHHLMDMPLPDKTLVVLVRRGDKFFVPTGKTELFVNDKLLIITDDMDALAQTVKNMNIGDDEQASTSNSFQRVFWQRKRNGIPAKQQPTQTTDNKQDI